MPNRIDVAAEIMACDRIDGLNEGKVDHELSEARLDPAALLNRVESQLRKMPAASAAGGAPAGTAEKRAASASLALGAGPGLAVLPATDRLAVLTEAIRACAEVCELIEMAGTVKFFIPSKGYGFLATDDEQGDVLVHVSCLERAGYRTAYEGARIHALVQKTPRGLQAMRIISMDESCARHPSQIEPRTREKVRAQSEWVRAVVKWYHRERGFGFVHEPAPAPDCFVHADTLDRWGVAPLHPGQVVEIRWGMGSKGRMVAEIRHPDGLSSLPPVH